jgi:hypothetical protein
MTIELREFPNRFFVSHFLHDLFDTFCHSFLLFLPR